MNEPDITQLTDSIGNATNQVSSSAETITDAVNGLGDGIKLNAKNQEKRDNKSLENEENISDQNSKLLKTVSEMSSLFNELLKSMNIITGTMKNSPEKEAAEDEIGDDEDDDFDSSNDERDDNSDMGEAFSNISPELNLDDIGSIKGTNYFDFMIKAVPTVGNNLNKIGSAIFDLLEKHFANGSGSPLGGQVDVSANEKEKEGGASGGGDISGKQLAAYMKELSGPLESIASGILTLSLAIAILSIAPINAQGIIATSLLFVSLIGLMVALARVEAKYNENPKSLDDKEGNQQGSIMYVVKAFSQLVFTTVATFVIAGLLVKFLQENWDKTILGLLIIFGTAFGTLIVLEASSALVLKLLGDGDVSKSNIVQVVNAFSKLVFTIVILAVICYFFEDIIMNGLGVASLILLETAVFMIATIGIMNSILKDGSPELVDAFANLVGKFTALIAVVSILVIILGILPGDKVMQGIISMGLIMGLTTLMITMLARSLKKLADIDEAKLATLMGIMVATTAMILITSLVVIILAQQDPASLVGAMLALVLILTIPIIVMEIASKIDMGQAVKAMIGLLAASLIVVALAGLIRLTLLIINPDNVDAAIKVAIALVLMTVAVVAIAASIYLLAIASAGGYIFVAAGLALLSIAAVSIVSVALVGVAWVWNEAFEKLKIEPSRAMELAGTLLAITGAILLIATAIIVLGPLAVIIVPLMLLSLATLWAIKTFSKKAINLIGELGEELAEVNFEEVGKTVSGFAEGMAGIAKSFTDLMPPLAIFVVEGLIIAALLLASMGVLALLGRELIAITISFVFFGISATLFNIVVSQIPILDLTNITSAIDSLNGLSGAINQFEGFDKAKRKDVLSAMDFVNDFAKKLGKASSDNDAANKLNALAESLSKLAQTATGLQGVADALNNIKDATEGLGTVEMSMIEKMSGSESKAEVQENLARQRAEAAAAQRENPIDVGSILESLGSIVEAINDLKTTIESKGNDSHNQASPSPTKSSNEDGPQTLS